MLCRGCKIRHLISVLPLGEMPLANQLLNNTQPQTQENKYNLEVMMCNQCGLAQLKDLVSPEQLFSEYLYYSSHSDTMVHSAAQLVKNVSARLPEHSTVVEIASNDGYLLQHYLNKSFNILGIEPAQNIAAVANAKKIPTMCQFFTSSLAQKLKDQNYAADIIHANNVMAHVPDINDFIQGLKILLKPTGTAIIEVPYLIDLVNHCEFDTIYHEHVYYFALSPLKILFEKYGLYITDVEKLAIHGGSLRLFIQPICQITISASVTQLLEHEKIMQANQPDFFNALRDKIQKLKTELLELLTKLKATGKTIAAYGASAKGATLLNYFGIHKDILDFVVDRSPAKQNLYMPGVQLPIYAPEALLQKKPDYALLLTWNFAEEILSQQQNYRLNGGKFIIPIPELKVI